MSNVVYRKVGVHKGKKRIWLEGQKLASQGIEPGMRFSLVTNDDNKVLKIVFCDDGKRVVSRRKHKDFYLPVMDIRADDIEAVFGQAERIRAVIRSNEIIITIHHREASETERVERLIRKLCNKEPLDVGSLAHGGGILDHALHAGLDSAGVSSRLSFAVEIEGKYLDSSQRNNPIWDKRSIAIEAPMQDVETDKLPLLDILSAGLPCTGASLSGRSKNKLSCAEEHEKAGSLFVFFLNIIMATKPSVIILENVPPYQNSVSMMVIRQVLTGIGYGLHETILDGNVMGALEARKRLCVVGVTNGLKGFDVKNILPLRKKERTLNEIIATVDDDSPRWKKLDYLEAKASRDLKNGKGFKRQILTGNETYCGTIGSGYAKLRSTEPFLKHPKSGLQRIFMSCEHAKIKTIPGALIAGLSETIAHQVLGQSVIHTAFQSVGKTIGDMLVHNLNIRMRTVST